MKRRLVSLGIVLLTLIASPVFAQDTQDLIDQAVLPLPEGLRDRATVVHYPAPGESEVLREGTGELRCRLFSFVPQFFAQCHHEGLTAMFDRYYELLGQGMPSDDTAEVLDAEIRAGQLGVTNGGTEYVLSGPSQETAELTITVTVPGATGASTGLPTQEREDEPWLMWAGTEVAHVMIPRGVPSR